MTNKPETKDTPKTETPNPFTGFDPMTAWTTSQQAFHKMMTDAAERAHAFADAYATLEAQLMTRAQGAIANWAQLAQDAIGYSTQLTQQARKLGIETARKFGATGV